MEGEWSLGTRVLQKGCGSLEKRGMLSVERYIAPMDEARFADLPISFSYPYKFLCFPEFFLKQSSTA